MKTYFLHSEKHVFQNILKKTFPNLQQFIVKELYEPRAVTLQ